MAGRYILVLCSLNPDRTDVCGNKYPESGFVESKDYRPDSNMMHGLYGTLWGNYGSGRWLNKDPKAVCLVVKTEQNEEIISLDKVAGFIKFRTGMVVFNGTQDECSNYILDNTLKASVCS